MGSYTRNQNGTIDITAEPVASLIHEPGVVHSIVDDAPFPELCRRAVRDCRVGTIVVIRGRYWLRLDARCGGAALVRVE